MNTKGLAQLVKSNPLSREVDQGVAKLFAYDLLRPENYAPQVGFKFFPLP